MDKTCDYCGKSLSKKSITKGSKQYCSTDCVKKSGKEKSDSSKKDVCEFC